MCESDDLLIIYDVKREAVFDWFVRKDAQKRVNHFEEDAQNCVRVWSAIRDEKYEKVCDRLSKQVGILGAAIRSFLGRLDVTRWLLLSYLKNLDVAGRCCLILKYMKA